MKESGPTNRRRAAIAIAALLGVLFALLPATPANAATGTITVGYPNKAGVAWNLGTTQQITWSTGGGLSGAVKIQLYDGATPGPLVKASVPASAGAFTWAIPVTVATSATYKVQVSSLLDGTILDQSDNVFALNPPAADVLIPDGGENWKIGTRKTITWDLPIPGNVLVQLDTNGTRKTLKTLPAAAGAFDWDIPISQATGSLFKIRVASASSTNIYADSAAVFQISAPTVTVTAPGNVQWLVGTTHDIKWTAPFVGNVRIDLINGATTKVIKASVPAKAGQFSWDIPLNLATSSTYRVKVTATDNPLLTALSTPSLDITIPALSGVTPTGGTVAGNTKQIITWSPGAIGSAVTGNVKIDLTGGPTPILIKASVPAAAGTYTWDVPLTLSTSTPYRVRITSVGQSAITISSLATFTASEPAPDLTFPANGNTWTAGTTRQITWDYDVPGNVSISLLKGGTFVSIIKASVPARSDTFSWAIPLSLAAGANYSVEIRSLTNKLLVGTGTAGANNLFTITLPAITANNPGTLTAGTTETITWSKVAGSVRLAYSTDGVTFTTIKASVPGSQGSFSWDVPIGLATLTTYRILVASTTNPNIKGVSGLFTMAKPAVTLTLPANLASFSKSSTQLIQWSLSDPGLKGDVKIELISSGGTTKVIKASTPVSNGQYSWVVGTSTAPGTYTLKVTLLGRTDVSSSISVTIT